MAFELTTWLKELNADGTLSAEELATLQGALSKDPKVVKRLEEGQLRQSDYSRRMGELTEKEKQTLALQTQLVEWKSQAEAAIAGANLTARQEGEERGKLNARLQHVITTYNIDPASVGMEPPAGGDLTKKTTAPGNGNPPNPEFLTRAEWEKLSAEMKATYPLLPAVLHDLSVQHQVLFGKPLENSAALVQKAMTAGKPIQTVWEEEFKVAEKRTELHEAAIQTRITEAVTKRESELRSELQLPPSPRATDGSPILREFRPTPDASKQQEMSAVDRAVNAFGEHKYAPATT